ncbi:hypothetical protein BPJM79_40281 [Bacillus pumilus]
MNKNKYILLLSLTSKYSTPIEGNIMYALPQKTNRSGTYV